ncbi:MAG: M48 family metallopeptidase [Sphingomonadales bacterium]|nr:M48 family metallopeptidase [Sphingomonadales bacterium]
MVSFWPPYTPAVQAMRLVFKQFLVLLVGFILIWAVLSTMEWVKLLRIKENTQATEDKIGKLLWEQISNSETVLERRSVTEPMDELLSRLCSRNGIEKSRFRLHIVDNSEINAFAMPGGHIVVYTGLLEETHNEAEIMGILAHEMSHVLLRHVMKSLGAEVGMTVLANAASGGIGGETLNQMAKFLAQGAYSRSLEEEADRNTVQLLVSSGISPLPMADFLKRMTKEDKKDILESEWLSTHPDAQKRAKNISQWAGADTITVAPVLSNRSWQKLREGIRSDDQIGYQNLN